MRKKEIDQHHLFLKRKLWWIRFTMPESLGGQRVRLPTGTSDLVTAAAIRDRILTPILAEGNVADIGRTLIASIKTADDTGRALIALADEELNRTTPTGPSLREVADRFLANRRDFKGRNGHTLDDYRRTLIAFEKVVTNVPVESIEALHVRKFRDRLMIVGKRWMREADPQFVEVPPSERLSARTVVKQLKTLITFFNWAMKEDLVQKNPATKVDLPTFVANRSKPPPVELADALCSLPWPNAPTIGIMEWEAMPWFYRYTGARCGEIGQLQLQDVKTVEGVLVLDVVTLKTANRREQTEDGRHRFVPVAEKLKPHLKRVLAARSGASAEDYLFPRAGHRLIKSIAGAPFIRHAWGFSCLYNRHARKVADIHLHCWRSYAISQMARAGIPEEFRRRIVGHTTTGVHDGYTHIDLERLKTAVDTIA